MSAFIRFLARWRVPLGFLAGAVTLAFAQPTRTSLRAGLAVALCGEAVRVWAAGHLEKSREVTRSGPYRWMRHPLYVGSTIMAAGVMLAASSPVAAIVVSVYMFSTVAAAIVTEEAYLRGAFGDAYDRYAERSATPMVRRFSLARAIRNREYRALIGLLCGFALLALRGRLPL
jgi:protein-S-isoprenylcysteine O-methyltransferase Ste14